jgi:DNA uptake protein ComE-like DNA-binding protein
MKEITKTYFNYKVIRHEPDEAVLIIEGGVARKEKGPVGTVICDKGAEVYLGKDSEIQAELERRREVVSREKKKIDINTASAERLLEIDGIDDTNVGELIDLRPIESIEELGQVSGIGPATLDRIKSENIVEV